MTSVKLFKTIAFIGFGLINSSLARVVKTKGLAEKIHAYSRSEATRAKIKKLNIGDVLITKDGHKAVTSIDFEIQTVEVYNFEVSGERVYYADGFLVHNK